MNSANFVQRYCKMCELQKVFQFFLPAAINLLMILFAVSHKIITFAAAKIRKPKQGACLIDRDTLQ